MTRQPTPGVYENYREPGEFGEGVTVRYASKEEYLAARQAARDEWFDRTLKEIDAAGHPDASAMRVIDPDQWEPCSPAYISAGGCCASAPRVWNARDKNHWHPKPSLYGPCRAVEVTDEELRAVGFSAMARDYPRDKMALAMFAAFQGNVTADQLPNGMRYFPNEWTQKAWQRVADAARTFLAGRETR